MIMVPRRMKALPTGASIIDGKGDLQITLSDLPVGCSVDEALQLVQALQFTEEHEEVCPAGWMPGSHSQAQCEPQQGSLSPNTTRLADEWQAWAVGHDLCPLLTQERPDLPL